MTFRGHLTCEHLFRDPQRLIRVRSALVYKPIFNILSYYILFRYFLFCLPRSDEWLYSWKQTVNSTTAIQNSDYPPNVIKYV